MSYILDALKKSESERDGSDSSPSKSGSKVAFSSGGGHQKLVGPKSSNSAIWVAFLLIFILICLVAILFLTQHSTQSQENSERIQPKERGLPLTNSVSVGMAALEMEKATTNRETKSVSETQLGTLITPASVDIASDTEINAATNTALKTASEKETTNASVNSAALTEARAPFEALESIPTLEITGHTYSSVRDKRRVVMNAREWREGETIVKGVVLQEITQGGIILDVAGWPVVIGRSKGWQAIQGTN
ncbi:MAG: general secretion pathway protein GspB [Thalassolituus sp.]